MVCLIGSVVFVVKVLSTHCAIYYIMNIIIASAFTWLACHARARARDARNNYCIAQLLLVNLTTWPFSVD